MAAMALIDTPEAANRLARAIASDINAYNSEKVIQGVKNDDLFERLAAELEEGESLYRSRVSPELLARSNFYGRAIIDKIVLNKGHLPSKMW
jgi:hypothetical protein